MKKIVFVVSIFVALVMSGCRPETRNQMLGIPDDAILLSTENFSNVNTKTSVSGTSVQWVGGDEIDFYVGTGSKQTRGVVVSEGNAYVASALEGNGDIRGYYPAGITNGSETADNVVVKIPAEYSCSVSGGRQVIQLPMVAKADAGATVIKFKHLTAAVNVKLRNSLASDLYVDKVVVTSENYQVCTPSGVTIDLDNENLGNNLVSSTTGNRSVTVNFSGEDFLVASGNSDKSIQVPIRPIGADHLTIEVFCHSATKSYHYSYRPDDAVSALGRNVLLTAMVDLKLTDNGGHMTEVVVSSYRSVNMADATYPFTAQDGDTLYGKKTGSNSQCIIPDGYTVTLRGLSLTSTTIIAGNNSTINIEGKCSISGGYSRPAIFANSGKTFTIGGEGTLTATGGSGAAGIGCGPSYDSTYNQCGNIIISGGTVTANGGSGAAGIGTGNNEKNSCGTITIKNTVTSVTATKGSGAQHSIGKGNSSSTCGTVTIGGVEGYITDSPYTYPPAD